MYWKIETPETLKFLDYIKEKKTFIVFDLETTGLKKAEDRIVQFAANKYRIVDGYYTLVDSLDMYIKPPFPMEAAVMEIHGITNEFLANKPTEDECFGQIKDFIEDDAVISGYNIKKFDIPFLNETYLRNGSSFDPQHVVDIYTMAKEILHPSEVTDHSLKLCNVAHYFSQDENVSFHSAAEDIAATWNVGISLLKKFTGERTAKVAKEEAVVLSMSLFKPSGKVSRVYTTVQTSTGASKLYYDTKSKGWVDADETLVINRINMNKLHEEADRIAKERGCKDLNAFKGSYANKGGKLYA